MGGKEGTKKGHIILFRAGAHCARVLQLQFGEKGIRYLRIKYRRKESKERTG